MDHFNQRDERLCLALVFKVDKSRGRLCLFECDNTMSETIFVVFELTNQDTVVEWGM